jgi:signal transduction histidine kinase
LKNIKYQFLFFIGWVLPCSLTAQSVLKELETILIDFSKNKDNYNDSAQATIFNDIGYLFMGVNTDSCIYYLDKSITKAKIAKSETILRYALLNKATVLIWRSQFDEAQVLLSETIKVAENSGDDYTLIESYRMYAYLFQVTELWDQSWLYARKMETAARKRDDFNELFSDGEFSAMYANVYAGLGDYKKARYYFEEAIAWLKRDSMDEYLANLYLEYSISLRAERLFEKAKQCIDLAAAHYTLSEEQVQMADVNESYILLYNRAGKFDSALMYGQKALDFYKSTQSETDVQRVSLYMAQAYHGKNELQKAGTIAAQTFRYFKNRPERSLALTSIEILQDAGGQPINQADAATYLKEYIRLTKEIADQKSKLRAFEIIGEYELNVKQHENELLKNKFELQRQIVTILIISGLSILLLAGFLYVMYRQKNSVLQHVKLLQETAEENNSKLEKINSIKDRLISMIAHDIRSPLASVQTTLALTKDQTLTKKEFDDLGDILEGEIHHLRGMLDNMLLWARQQLIEVKVEKQQLVLKELVDDTVQLFQSNIKHKSLQVESSIEGNEKVYSDRNILQTVVRNILSNAIKFSSPGKKIFIIHKREAGKSLLTVKDEGLGIQPDDLAKIEKSEYLSTRGTSNEKGTGLGLLFSRELLQKLGETLKIESIPGEGTTVTITIS